MRGTGPAGATWGPSLPSLLPCCSPCAAAPLPAVPRCSTQQCRDQQGGDQQGAPSAGAWLRRAATQAGECQDPRRNMHSCLLIACTLPTCSRDGQQGCAGYSRVLARRPWWDIDADECIPAHHHHCAHPHRSR
jgi:hypothetical protein